MKKEEFRSAFKEVVAKSLEPSICKVMEVLSSNFEAGVECGIAMASYVRCHGWISYEHGVLDHVTHWSPLVLPQQD